MVGILSGYCDDTFFDDALLDLQAIADNHVIESLDIQECELPQVHALNCLKDIFTDSRFGLRTDHHIENLLCLAAECLDSPVYA